MLSSILAFFGYQKQKKFNYTGRVKDIGMNDDGELLIVLELREGNYYDLKTHLANHEKALMFSTEPIEIGEDDERD